MVPTSLLARATDTTVVAVGTPATAAARTSGSTRPRRSTARGWTVPPNRAAASAPSPTVWWSTAPTRIAPGRAPTTPARAVASDSVPPEVNTTSPGPHPTRAATASRASSTARRAWRAAAWAPDGLPWCAPRNGSMASTASGRTGVLAVWSR